MRKLLTCTTALSVALSSAPVLPSYAQTLTEDGSVIGPDGAVLCTGTPEAPCDLEAITRALRDAEAAAAAAAEEAAAAQAAAEAAAAQAAEEAAAAEAEAARAADEAAAAQAAAEAEAARAADEAAAAQAAAEAEAARAADEAAAAQAAAEAEAARAADEAAAAQAAAEAEAARAADEAAAAQAAADAESAGAADEAAAAQAAAEAEAAKAADEAAAAQAAADAEAARAADEAAAAQAAAEAEAAGQPGEEAVPAEPEAEVTEAPAAEDPAEDPAAGLASAPEDAVEVAPVDAPVVSEEAAASLDSILAAPTVTEEIAQEAEAAPAGSDEVVDPAPAPIAEAATAVLSTSGAAPGSDAAAGTEPADPALAPVAVVSEVISAETTRSSDQEFAAAPVAVSGGKKSGLSDLEKVGLVALGALVVGAVINNGKKDAKTVVSNSGDRVVVQNPDGTYTIYKDDDAVLRRPGVQTTTETYRDGSTRTVVQRADGTQVVTVRDASGRVLRRATYDRNGQELILIDDLYPEERIDITKLPKLKPGRVTISTSDSDAGLKAELAALEAADLGRKFSLRQIREIPQVRALAATIEVDAITFDTGSSAIKATEARKLADIGRLMQQLLAANPREVFLIEGHTDAVGSAASNLSLSDRRAESMALALTEYFDIPPENLVVQGYGESELKVDSAGDERANRRVVVRLVTPLMRTAELR